MLIRHTVLYLPAQLVGPGVQFIAVVLWTHWLAPDAYGVLAYILALQELASVACVSWWSQYMLRYVGSFADSQAQEKYQRVENAVLLASAFVQIAVVFGALGVLHTAVNAPLLIATVVYTVSRSIVTHLAERARARGAIGLYTAAQLIGPVAGFALGFALVSGVSASPAAALAGLAVANIGVLAGLWSWMRLGFHVSLPDRAILRRAFSFGAPLVLAGAISWASLNGIRVVVERLDGAAAVGLVSVGWGLGQRLASVVAMLVTAAAFPLAVSHLQAGRRKEALDQIALNAAILFGLLAPATAGVLLLTPDLVNLTIAPAFRDMTIAILPIAALAGAVRNFRVHFSDQALILLERTGTTVLVNAVEAAATLSLCWLGLSRGGLPGAVLGCLAGATRGAVFCFILAMARHGLPLPAAHFMRTLAATLIMTGVLRFTPWHAVPAPLVLRIAVEIASGGVIYALSLAAFYPGQARGGLRRLRALGSPAGP